MNINIEDIKKLQIKKNDILFIKVDVRMMPKKKSSKYIMEIYDIFKNIDQLKDVEIVVIPNNITIGIVEKIV